jgi:hypothetical protein
VRHGSTLDGVPRPTGPAARRAVVRLALVAAVGVVVAGSEAAAQEDPPDTTLVASPGELGAPDTTPPPGTAPLVLVPSGCARPALPEVVFTGTLVDRDFRTGRFRIEQVRAGDETPFTVAGLIDVRYGTDVQALELDRAYVVSAGIHPELGVLFSQIRAPAPPFGGDDVVGVEDSDVPCPVLEDPVRTLELDGTSVESGVFTPLFDERSQLLGALLVPLGVAVGAVAALAALRLLLDGMARGVRSLSRRPR